MRPRDWLTCRLGIDPLIKITCQLQSTDTHVSTVATRRSGYLARLVNMSKTNSSKYDIRTTRFQQVITILNCHDSKVDNLTIEDRIPIPGLNTVTVTLLKPTELLPDESVAQAPMRPKGRKMKNRHLEEEEGISKTGLAVKAKWIDAGLNRR